MPRQPTSVSTEWDGLKPQNVVQAAKADIERRKRNEERAADGGSWASPEYESYAFYRGHVKRADGAFGLIQLALDEILASDPVCIEGSLREKIACSNKRYMKHLYEPTLLRAALAMEKSDEH
jgi:hypothetical protein